MSEIQWEPALLGNEIGVSVNEGVVMLSGIVDTYYKKRLAEKVSKKVNGVKAVAEEILVKVPGSNIYTDVDIAKAALSALKWNSAVNENTITVQVENAQVTLEGDAEWAFQKLSAQKAIENLNGVCCIINNIHVKNKIAAEGVLDNIMRAFERNAIIDSAGITVNVIGDKLILTGTVRSYAEKKDAENVAWSSPGVMHVDNQLMIDSSVNISSTFIES
ncbi:BON domain-containing protein [Aurantibacillus circumpalustris]|uniref:BON domain-containing protein n=1 Tax=Aurantibacillus circumpalustris TaxID=3036359 RepID=UPI0037BFE56B